MQVFVYPDKKNWTTLAARPVVRATQLDPLVKQIMKDVQKKGDKAVKKYTRKFDRVVINNLFVTEKEMLAAEKKVPEKLKMAIRNAKKNIESFHKSQKEKIKKINTMPGITCWRQCLPIEKVGFYIPGGSAPLFSTVLMLGVPAQIANCKEVVLSTPPLPNGTVHPAILFAAKTCGITKIVKCGGVQAIAAMTYGTETVSKVFKIFGPGNQYVTAAKQFAQQQGVAIDMPAGPSEVLVIADNTAIPAYVAADLLSQAEHGTDSQVILVTTENSFGEKVLKEINNQLKNLSRKEIIKATLRNSKLIVVKNRQEAIDFSNQYAPEHLILAVADAEKLAQSVTSAGSVFIGNFTPESAGDYASGTNHTLPTNGYAAMYSGVSFDSFVKKVTFQQLTKKGLTSIGNTVMEMAAAEGLGAHKNAVAIRLKD